VDQVFFCLEPDGGVGAGEALGACLLILILLEDFPATFLFFFLGVGLVVAFRLPARVLEAWTLALTDGSLANSLLGDHAKIGMAGIGMSPSNLGIGEIELSKACIQKCEY
jgi:hypothetical protein